MITEQELNSLESFGKEPDGYYSDRDRFSIEKIGGKWVLFFSGETEGDDHLIKVLKNMDDLKNVYKAITDKELV